MCVLLSVSMFSLAWVSHRPAARPNKSPVTRATPPVIRSGSESLLLAPQYFFPGSICPSKSSQKCPSSEDDEKTYTMNLVPPFPVILITVIWLILPSVRSGSNTTGTIRDQSALSFARRIKGSNRRIIILQCLDLSLLYAQGSMTHTNPAGSYCIPDVYPSWVPDIKEPYF